MCACLVVTSAGRVTTSEASDEASNPAVVPSVDLSPWWFGLFHLILARYTNRRAPMDNNSMQIRQTVCSWKWTNEFKSIDPRLRPGKR